MEKWKMMNVCTCSREERVWVLLIAIIGKCYGLRSRHRKHPAMPGKYSYNKEFSTQSAYNVFLVKL